MPLIDIDLPLPLEPLPPPIQALLDEADLRVERFLQHCASSEHGFVTSDFVAVYRALRQIGDRGLSAGGAFCEWGSGFGVATLLASELGFDACGVEIDARLIDEAIDLAECFDIDAQFVHGSFVPPGGEVLAEESYAGAASGPVWLATDSDDAYQELELDVDDFDLIYAYPWPGEAESIERLFLEFAAEGALLLTYEHLESMRLVRKVGRDVRG